jgi:hypothetical protein
MERLISARSAAGLTVAIWSAAMVQIAIRGGAQHDYVAYLSQWKLVLNDADPWSTDNTYGPLHVVLGYLLPFGTLVPKLVMVGCLLAANAALAICLIVSRLKPIAYLHYLIVILANVDVISIGIDYGLNDALAAALITIALLLRFRQLWIGAGVMLGLAVLLKYYPIVLILPFALENRRWRGSLVLAAAVTIGAGFAVSWAVYGDGFIAAMRFGAARPPKILSILSALAAKPGLIGGSATLEWLVDKNAIFVMLVAASWTLIAWLQRISWLEASVGTLLAVLLTYKVGHQQFFLPWLFLVGALPLLQTPSADRLAWMCWPFAIFLSLFEWGYAYGSDEYHQILGEVRTYVGFVAFPLGLATIGCYFRFARRGQAAPVRRAADPIDLTNDGLNAATAARLRP